MLRKVLDDMRRSDDAATEVRDAVAATLAELRRSDVTAQALGIGEPFPDFLLPDAEGRLVERGDLIAGGPAVVTFFRGDWCPYCGASLDALEAVLPAMEAAGASLAAVMPETGGRALHAKRRHAARYRVLADVDHGLAMACGVAFRVPGPYRTLLLSEGVNLAERQGNAAWFLPVPATFVLDRAGVVRWSYVDLDFTRRAEPDDVVAALRSIPGP